MAKIMDPILPNYTLYLVIVGHYFGGSFGGPGILKMDVGRRPVKFD